MPARISMIFQLTTEAEDREIASPHIAGWSEGFWENANNPVLTGNVRELLRLRALLLPLQAAIIGVRRANYTIEGNRLVPGGTASAKVNYPGRAALHCDLPQTSLQLSLVGDGGNTSRISLRGMPDSEFERGEFQPNAGYKGALTQYRNYLVEQAYGFMGRDLSKPTARIVAIAANGAVQLRSSTGAVVGDYVRLLNVKDTNGKNVQGTFRVGTVAVGGLTMTLDAWPEKIVQESGSMRVDAVRYCDIISVDVSRAVVRKVGRPFEQYRGRASKR